MPDATPDQIFEIARLLSGFARAVDGYRADHLDGLSDSQEDRMRGVADDLRAASNKLANLGINLSLDAVQAAVAGLTTITRRLDDDLKHIADLTKALKVAGILAGVGAAFATGNPAGIVAALAQASNALPDVISGVGGV